MKRGPSSSSQAAKRQMTSPAAQYELNASLIESLENRDLEGVKTALYNGADPHGQGIVSGRYQREFIAEAASIPNVGFIAAFLQAGADPNFQYTEGRWSALHAAILANNIGVIVYLLQHGANVNIYDMNHGTPLLYAVTHNIKL